MKKEDIKKFLWVVMALTLVVFSVGFGGLAFLIRQIYTQGRRELYDWNYNKLSVAILVVFVIACVIAVALILLLILNLTKLSKKQKFLANVILFSFVCVLSVVLIILSAVILNPNKFIGTYSKPYYLSFVGQTLEIAIPCLIFSISGFFLIFFKNIFKNIENDNVSE